MTRPTLFWNEDQDDDALLLKYVNDKYGLTWYFEPHKLIDAQTRIDELKDKHNRRGFGWAVATLAVQSVRWEGEITVLPATYKERVTDAEGTPVTDKKTGKHKTRPHRYAGKQSKPDADLIEDMPDEVVAGAYAFIMEHYGARSVAAQEDFRESDPSSDAPEATDD